MSDRVREVVASFEALPDSDKHDAVVEILRRTRPEGDVPAATLDGLADELFAVLDDEEDGRADR